MEHGDRSEVWSMPPSPLHQLPTHNPDCPAFSQAHFVRRALQQEQTVSPSKPHNLVSTATLFLTLSVSTSHAHSSSALLLGTRTQSVCIMGSMSHSVLAPSPLLLFTTASGPVGYPIQFPTMGTPSSTRPHRIWCYNELLDALLVRASMDKFSGLSVKQRSRG
ncbi:hypothetical protein EI94DRAFT_1731712 [Lactarius quietus]|nr:hypothetical protein EI94DRAFT_1731712 [Lactarius quietus]